MSVPLFRGIGDRVAEYLPEEAGLRQCPSPEEITALPYSEVDDCTCICSDAVSMKSNMHEHY